MPDTNNLKFDKDNIQADIWPGLLKKYEIFCFFNIADAPKFKPQLEKIANEVITPASRAQDMRGQTFEHKSMLAKGTIKSPERLPIAGVNIAFSHNGLEKLGKTDLKDPAFSKGQFHSMVTDGRDQEDRWLNSFREGVDGVLLICGEKEKVENRLAWVEKSFLGKSHGVNTIETIRGEDLKGDKAGHEHFGFKDGIAQPQLEVLDNAKANTPRKSFRSTPPGFIINGYDEDEEPSWAKDGSYLVFRKLKQHVPEFKNFLQHEASRLGYTQGQLGARLVGRWESGAPVETNPDIDNLGDAEKDDFDFKFKDQSKCPFAAHIRKSRPRGDVKNFFGAEEAKFDIMRRGIPYGPEVTDDELKQNKTTVDRGLLFACYQSSLTNGFEFITNSWFNNNEFPPVEPVIPGADPIMTDRAKDSSKKLRMNILDRKGDPNQIDFDPFVESHGGSYFFMPSLAALREMAQAK